MQFPKQISSLIGIIIIVAVAIVTFGSVFAYQYFLIPKTESVTDQTASLITEKDLLGYWKIGNAEPIAFCDYDSTSGFGEYRSYLHERPVFWGTWQLDKTGKLTIQYDIPGEKPIVINSVTRTGNALTLKGNIEFDGTYTLVLSCDGHIVYSNSTAGSTAGWKTYTNSEYGFEFRYPDALTISKEKDKITIIHSIPFVHTDPCDFKGGAPQLQKLTDFNVGVEVVDNDIINTIIKGQSEYFVLNYVKNNKIEIVKDFIDEVDIGGLKGYKITSGVEGCGEYTYYFIISPQKTLLLKRPFITELINEPQQYLKLSGIIKPEEEVKLFNQIISTFKFTR